MKLFVSSILFLTLFLSAIAQNKEQPYTNIAELIMKLGNEPYGEGVLQKLGFPLYSNLGDNEYSSVFDGIDMNGKHVTIKMEKEKNLSDLAYIAFIVDSCYYDNIIQDLLNRNYQIYKDERSDKSYGFGTIAHQKIYKSDNVMCVVQTGNNYLKGKIYLYYTFRHDNPNQIEPSRADVEVADFNIIFDPENNFDTDWNNTEIESDLLRDAGVYFNEEKQKFYELKPFYDLRQSALSPIEGIRDNGTSVHRNAVYNTLEPIRRINASKSKILEYLNRTVYIQPQFLGGDKALMDYLHKNFKMPKKINFDGNILRSRVIVTFDIDENGNVVNVAVSQSVSPEIDKECVRVVKSLPNFIPGTVDGKPQKFTGFRLPINIKNDQTSFLLAL